MRGRDIDNLELAGKFKCVSVRVETRSRVKFPLDVEKLVKRLLAKIPSEHLQGLDSILIVDVPSDRPANSTRGRYLPKSGKLNPARIEIAPQVIYRGVPRTLFRLPFICEFMLANVLYHEIGHHHQQFIHGVSKHRAERFAEKYKREMIRKAFFWWRIFLLPIASLVRRLREKSGK